MATQTITCYSSVYFNTSAIADAGQETAYAGYRSGWQRTAMAFNSFNVANTKITKVTLSYYQTRCSGTRQNMLINVSNSIDFTSTSGYNHVSSGATKLVNDVNNQLKSTAIQFPKSDVVNGWVSVDLTTYASAFVNKSYVYIFQGDKFQNNDAEGYVAISGAQNQNGNPPRIIIEYEYLASSFTMDSNAITLESNFNIYVNASSGSYYHKLTFTLGDFSRDWTIFTGGGTRSGTCVAEYAKRIPNSTSAMGTVTLTTYSDSGLSNVIGTYSRNVTYYVPSTATFLPEWRRDNYEASHSAPYYANHTTWKYKVSGNGKYGASITSVVFQFRRASDNVVTFTASGSTGVSVTVPTQSAGEYEWITTITDSRGFTTTTFDTPNTVVNAYTPIYFSGLSIRRTDASGNDAVEGEYYKLGGTIRSSRNITSVIIDNGSAINPSTSTYDLSSIAAKGTISKTDAKTVSIKASDGVKTIEASVTLPSAQYILYFKKGGGALGIGKAASTTEDGCLDIGWRTKITNANYGHGILTLSSPSTAECSIYYYPSNSNYMWALGTGCNGLGSDSFTLYSQNAQRNIFTTTVSNAHFYGYSFTVSNPTAVTRVTQIPANGYVSIFADNEGGNIEIRSTDDYKRFYQFDAEGGSLRCFSHHIKTDNTDSGHDTTGFTYDGATGNVNISSLSVGTMTSALAWTSRANAVATMSNMVHYGIEEPQDRAPIAGEIWFKPI